MKKLVFVMVMLAGCNCRSTKLDHGQRDKHHRP